VLVRQGAQPALVGVPARQAQQVGDEPGPGGRRCADHDVLEDRQAPEQADSLQRAGDAE
jgi:hypothetical protein